MTWEHVKLHFISQLCSTELCQLAEAEPHIHAGLGSSGPVSIAGPGAGMALQNVWAVLPGQTLSLQVSLARPTQASLGHEVASVTGVPQAPPPFMEGRLSLPHFKTQGNQGCPVPFTDE